MCGILGYIGNPKKALAYNFLMDGMVAIQSRGKDATGIFSSNIGAVLKAPIKADEFIKLQVVKRYVKQLVSMGHGTVLAHTRAWTLGEPEDNNNNHPLFTDEVTIIHNGVVKAKKIEGYPYKGKTDTEWLLSYIHDSDATDEAERVAHGVRNVSGSLAIVVYFRESGNTYLYRDSSPMFVGKLGATILFASTEDIMYKALGKTRPGSFFHGVEVVKVPENMILKVTKNKGDLSFCKKVEPQSYVYTAGFNSRGNSYHNQISSYDGNYDNDESICALGASSSLNKAKPSPNAVSQRVRKLTSKLGGAVAQKGISIRHARTNFVFIKHKMGKSKFNLIVEVDKKCTRATKYKNNHDPNLSKDLADLFKMDTHPKDRTDFTLIGGEPKDNKAKMGLVRSS